MSKKVIAARSIKTVFNRTTNIISSTNKYGNNDGVTDISVKTAQQTKTLIKSSKTIVSTSKKTVTFAYKSIFGLMKAGTAIISNIKLMGLVAIIILIVVVINSIGAPMVMLKNILDPKVALTILQEVLGLKKSMLDKIMEAAKGMDEVRILTPDKKVAIIDIKKMLAYLAAKNNEKLDGSEKQLTELKNLYSKMYTYKIEGVNNVTVGETLEIHRELEVTINLKDVEKIIEEENWTEKQIKSYKSFLGLIDLKELYPNLDLSELEIKNVLYESGDLEKIIESSKEIDVSRKELINVARTLIGKGQYFWGGKSAAGYNPLWGSMVLVTAPGHKTTGTYQPFGLDCSGFVDWVYKTAGAGNILSLGTTNRQWNATYAVNGNDLLPGDLAFKGTYPNTTHVGIFSGYNANGVKTYIHCTGGVGVVEQPTMVFTSWRRTMVNFKGE